MEEQERLRRMAVDFFGNVDEAIQREILRRQTWVMEETERRRRILEGVTTELQEAVLTEVERLVN
jgi:hypothetical protein